MVRPSPHDAVKEENVLGRNLRREHFARKATEQVARELGIHERNTPKIALVLGEGWGDALTFDERHKVSLEDIEGFHDVELREEGTPYLIHGLLAGVPVIALLNRVHLHEAPDSNDLFHYVRLQTDILFHLGVRTHIFTGSAGSLDTSRFKVKEVAVVKSLLTAYAPSAMPLWGKNERVCPEKTMDRDLRDLAIEVSRVEGMPRAEVADYAIGKGSYYEGLHCDKPLVRELGASVIGMNLLPELCIAALYEEEGRPIRSLPLLFVTNNDREDYSYETARARAAESSMALADYLTRIVRRIAETE